MTTPQTQHNERICNHFPGQQDCAWCRRRNGGTVRYYQDETVTIYHGDCRDVMPHVGRGVIVTDPPYGTQKYAADVEVLTGALLREWIADHDAVAVFGWPESLAGLCVAARVVPDEWVTWWPTNKPGARSSGLSKETEHVAIFGATPGAAGLVRPRSADATGRAIAVLRGNDPDWARLGDVWIDPSPGCGFNAHQRLHTNQKPLAVMSKLIQLCCATTADTRSVVIDPFCGSGTTLRAAKDLGYRAVGIEIDEAHCATAAERMTQEVLDVA